MMAKGLLVPTTSRDCPPLVMFNPRFLRLVSVYLILSITCEISAKVDEIKLQDDDRNLIHMVSYGMNEGGYLRVRLNVTASRDTTETHMQGFKLTIDRTSQSSPKSSEYEESSNGKTSLCESNSPHNNSILFWFNSTALDGTAGFNIYKHLDLSGINIEGGADFTQNELPSKAGGKRSVGGQKEQTLPPAGSSSVAEDVVDGSRRKRAADSTTITNDDVTSPIKEQETTTVKNIIGAPAGEDGVIPVYVELGDFITFNVSFTLRVEEKAEAGMYTMFLHNCVDGGKIFNLTALIVGKNTQPLSYLSAGDIPEPYLYFTVCITYVLVSLVWLYVLRNASSGVFKTHYVMLALCYCKALSALFHGTNYYIIGNNGREETTWAVIYYISYLMKTIMLFLTILLVGTGWTFIKHVFSDREKKLFLITIPLQVLVYVSQVIMEETEVATQAYSTWQTISIVVDLLCCAAILLPVIWSIRHLTEASQTDGKAALNLQKLRLFKSLYVLVISYIYITRIVIYVFRYTLPYQCSWLGDLFREITVLLFLLTLGYKFRPADENPYFQVPPDSDEEEEEETAITQSGLTTETKRRNLVTRVDTEDVEKQTLIAGSKTNESSHEFD